MNLRQIEVFRSIMSSGSVSSAAQLMHVSVPAVSKALSHAESQLGFPLFERSKGRLVPTTEARKLYREVESVHRGVQRIKELSHQLSKLRHGLVSVVTSPSIGQMLIPQAIAHFKSGNPDVHVHFHCLSHALLEERLVNRLCDLGVSMLPMQHPDLLSVPIARSRIVCICPRGHAFAGRLSISIEELVTMPMITYPPDSPFGERVERMLAARNAFPKSQIEVGSPQNACAIVHAGAGMALVDEFSLQSWLDARFSVVPLDQVDPIVASLVYPRSEPLSEAAQSLVRSFKSVLLQAGLPVLDKV
ncbi:LysR family transcriptional regulator [Variovorax sp. J31P207]|uniref:LysR family transcriptional regulator n=1 Tax=Variovorax sp. J31P207 TaxID=3053510 RepID=UPI00257829B8|nr:LysR family transcriptional regulator [Variovorax sp. J31P207]MDM0071580.1 LysR family transcriptional regulator [Variovorax sp. J31P207]